MDGGFPATKVMLERAANAHQNTLKAHLKEFSEEGASGPWTRTVRGPVHFSEEWLLLQYILFISGKDFLKILQFSWVALDLQNNCVYMVCIYM